MYAKSMFKGVLACAIVATLGLQASIATAGGVKTIKLLPETVTFKPGPNRDLVREVCMDCHSADYVAYQPPQDRAGWKAVSDRMRDVFNMDPLSATVESDILDYLVANYGK